MIPKGLSEFSIELCFPFSVCWTSLLVTKVFFFSNHTRAHIALTSSTVYCSGPSSSSRRCHSRHSTSRMLDGTLLDIGHHASPLPQLQPAVISVQLLSHICNAWTQNYAASSQSWTRGCSFSPPHLSINISSFSFFFLFCSATSHVKEKFFFLPSKDLWLHWIHVTINSIKCNTVHAGILFSACWSAVAVFIL